MNSQPIEKRRADDAGTSLDVHSVFRTIQGEGPYTGHPAIFIRLAGCNLQCPMCDTDYTSKREELDVDTLVTRVRLAKHGSKLDLVVITGGEPFRQNITPLVTRLLGLCFNVQVETNGTLALPDDLAQVVETNPARYGCHIVVSPKAGKVHPSVEAAACAYKYVMAYYSEDADGLPKLALDHSASPRVARPPEGRVIPIYLQPMDSADMDENDGHLAACIDSCIAHGYTLQLQVHKLINLE